MEKCIANIPVFNYMEKNDCTGCEACANSCPTGCISMIPDEEGFLFPYGDMNKCIKCNKCVHSCPVQHITDKKLFLDSYAGYIKNEKILKKSASGGMFSLIVDAFYARTNGTGYVDGVVWTDDYTNAIHVVSTEKALVDRMRSSKYIQSYKGNIYSQIKILLERGEYVLFSGTPCEAAGLKSYLNKEYEKLYVVDIVCQGPTSPSAMKQFMKSITRNGRKQVKAVDMRYVKVAPWIPQWIKIDFADGTSSCKLFYETTIGRSMHIMQRRACYKCSFNGSRRCSDITIGDYHGADPDADYYNAYGTSIMIINTDKGNELFKLIDRNDCHLVSLEYDAISAPNPRIIQSGVPHVFRDRFGDIYTRKGLAAAAKASWSVRQKLRMRIPYSIRLMVRKIKKR